MSLRGMKLHLALLAMASSSGYLLFYLASDSHRMAITQDLAHWSRFVVEAPGRYFASSADPIQQTTLPAAQPSMVSNTEILLSGTRNNAPTVSPSPVPGAPYPVRGDFRTALKNSLDMNTGNQVMLAEKDTSPVVSDIGVSPPPVTAPTLAQQKTHLLLSPARGSSGEERGAEEIMAEEATAFMDTSLLVTQKWGISNTNRGLSPTSATPEAYPEEEGLDELLQSETTAGRVSPGDSLGDEINLAARAYISNTAELRYPASVGFVVWNPETELMIYALAAGLETPHLATPNLPPTLSIYDADGELVASSDPLQQDQTSDPAIVHVFPPGAYQVIVQAAKGSAGEVVVGVKDYYSVEVE